MNTDQELKIINTWTESFFVEPVFSDDDSIRGSKGTIRWEDFESRIGLHDTKADVIRKGYTVVSTLVYDVILEMVEEGWKQKVK